MEAHPFTLFAVYLTITDGFANSEDLDQTARGLHYCPVPLSHYTL